MKQSIKYRIVALMDDKFFIFITVLLFTILNYNVFIDSGVLSLGDSSFNGDIKSTLLINNFIIVCSVYALLTSVYIGMGIFGKDIESGQIYIMLTSFPKRYKYYWGNWIGLVITIILVLILLILNFIMAALVLGVQSNINDIFIVFRDVFTNMLVLMTLTFVSSIHLKGYKSAIVGILGLAVFNLYAFLKIPFVEAFISISTNSRRFLASLIPIVNITSPSMYNKLSSTYHDVIPFIISNKFIYQFLYIAVMLVVGQYMFKRKEIM